MNNIIYILNNKCYSDDTRMFSNITTQEEQMTTGAWTNGIWIDDDQIPYRQHIFHNNVVFENCFF